MALSNILQRRPLIAALPALLAATALGGCSSDDGGDDGNAGGSGGAGGAAGGGGGTGGAGPTGDPNWTMLGYDVQSTYWNKGETKITRDTVGNLTKKWSMDLGGNINGAPLQVDGRIYAASSTNRNVCIDIETQNIVWENNDLLVQNTFAYVDGTLYAHDFGGLVWALDADTGTMKWTAPTTDQGSIGFSSPIPIGNQLVIGGSNAQELLGQEPTFRGFVVAIDTTTQAQAWNTFMVAENETGASLWSSVSSDGDGKIYVGTGNNYKDPASDTSDAIRELSASDGTVTWTNQRYEGDTWSIFNIAAGKPDYDFGANPIVFEADVDGTMTKLVADGQKSGDFHVLKREDGSEVATRSLGPGSQTGSAGVFNNGAWDGTHLLAVCNSATSDQGEPQDSQWTPGVIFAMDPATLDIVWERQLPGPVLAPITVANGVVFVPADRHLVAYDTDTGEKLFEYVAESTIASAPTISDGKVVFGQGIQWQVGSTGTLLTVLELP